MFYCKACQEEKNWPETMSRSVGACEICGKRAECFDAPSSRLPTISETKLAKEDWDVFQKMLARPAQISPGLQKLLSEPSVLEQLYDENGQPIRRRSLFNWALPYGQDTTPMLDRIAKAAAFTPEKAKELLEEYHRLFPELVAWMERMRGVLAPDVPPRRRFHSDGSISFTQPGKPHSGKNEWTNPERPKGKADGE